MIFILSSNHSHGSAFGLLAINSFGDQHVAQFVLAGSSNELNKLYLYFGFYFDFLSF